LKKLELEGGRCWEKERCAMCAHRVFACLGVVPIPTDCTARCWAAETVPWRSARGTCRCGCGGTWHGYGTAMYLRRAPEGQVDGLRARRPGLWRGLRELMEFHGLWLPGVVKEQGA